MQEFMIIISRCSNANLTEVITLKLEKECVTLYWKSFFLFFCFLGKTCEMHFQ